MPKQFITVALAALFCSLLGVLLYRWQGAADSMMNAWGVVSFGSLGACFGCLAQVSPS